MHDEKHVILAFLSIGLDTMFFGNVKHCTRGEHMSKSVGLFMQTKGQRSEIHVNSLTPVT